MGSISLKILPAVCIAVGLIVCVAPAQDDSPPKFSMATPDRWEKNGWWPTKGTPSFNEYTGPEACTRCHSEIAASQHLTPMFKAARKPSETVPQPQEFTFHDESYGYLLSRKPGELKFTISDKSHSAVGMVGWVFGAGEGNQTFVLKQKDVFLESRLSYFTNLAGLDITPGHESKAPPTIEQAMGDQVEPETIRRCFGCHSTASTVSGKFDPEHAMLGVTCEACHGPGLAHVTAMESAQPSVSAGSILSPARLSPVNSVDFCGACHRTPVDVAVSMPRHLGVSSIRFQPYRLERSLCWGAGGDPRITCIACHDPHKPLDRDLGAYDNKCLSCHATKLEPKTSAKLAHACNVENKNCVSCHMQKIEIPWVHATFTGPSDPHRPTGRCISRMTERSPAARRASRNDQRVSSMCLKDWRRGGILPEPSSASADEHYTLVIMRFVLRVTSDSKLRLQFL
jgi:hypothetical protein